MCCVHHIVLRASNNNNKTMTSSIQRSRPPQHASRKTIRKGPIWFAVIVFCAVPLVLVNFVRTSLEGDELKYKLRDTMGGSPRADTGEYTGKLWTTDSTLGRTLLGETEFARCDVHSVVGADHKSIINDWIFLEERDHVNVAVYTKEGKFLLFQQRKYAIPGETLSPVGGFIDNGETPFDAARREVVEELGVGSKHTSKILKKIRNQGKSIKEGKSSKFDIPVEKIVLDEYGLAIGKVPANEQQQWKFLGRYRTAANRGGGFLYTYLLVDAIPVVENGGTAEYIRTGDDEEQKLLSLSTDLVATALSNGEFQEVKWTATLSLALLHIQRQESEAHS